MRIKTSWVALSVVVLAAGLLLVASLWDSLFSGGQQSAVPERSPPPGASVSAEPTATTAIPPPAPTAAAPSARPAPMPSGQSGAPPTAVVPSTSPAPLPPTAAAPPPAPTAAVPSAPANAPPTTPAAPVPSPPPPTAPPAATATAPPATPPPSALPAEAEMSAADRRQVQEALRRLGYYKGPADGIFGPLTRAAIRRFQQDIRSDATGYLTADQANRLVTPR